MEVLPRAQGHANAHRVPARNTSTATPCRSRASLSRSATGRAVPGFHLLTHLAGGTRAVVHEQLSWFIQVRRSAIRVPVRCAAGSAAYCLNKSRALTDARVRERFQRGWRGRRGGEGCGAARDAAHGAARRCVSRRTCPHRLILLATCLGVIVLGVTVLGGSRVKRHRARRAAGVTAVRRSRRETLRSARGVGPLLGRPAPRLSDNEFSRDSTCIPAVGGVY